MATSFSHGIVGAALLPAVPKSVPRSWALGLLLILPMIPDLDVVAFKLGIPYAHPLGHRGFSHSLVYAFLQGGGAAWLTARYFGLSRGDMLRVATVLFVATASHGAMDAMTDSGLGIAFFSPIDNGRYFFPVRPLATPPLGIRSFFAGDPLALMRSEMLLIWPFAVGIFLLLRASFGKSG